MIFHPTLFELEGGIVGREAALHHRSADIGAASGYTPLRVESGYSSPAHRLHVAAMHVFNRTAHFMAAVGEVHLRRQGMSILPVEQMGTPGNTNMQDHYE